jgi:hypothetical protein
MSMIGFSMRKAGFGIGVPTGVGVGVGVKLIGTGLRVTPGI